MRSRHEVADRHLGAGREDRAPSVLANRDATQSEHGRRARAQVEDQRRVPVHTQDEDVRRQLRLQDLQAALAEVAETRIVIAAFGIVVVRHDRHRQAEGREQV